MKLMRKCGLLHHCRQERDVNRHERGSVAKKHNSGTVVEHTKHQKHGRSTAELRMYNTYGRRNKRASVEDDFFSFVIEGNAD